MRAWYENGFTPVHSGQEAPHPSPDPDARTSAPTPIKANVTVVAATATFWSRFIKTPSPGVPRTRRECRPAGPAAPVGAPEVDRTGPWRSPLPRGEPCRTLTA